ncbi:cytoplasmic tRNA 2-thiolation protein 2-A isoform X1 [Schistocerca nitens]|uniref:cytoplasmic tRNA 2-thiolation protein 2-A isoform X1 n=2 Tax=Schistocerca nitens TaxID=7011 RepID=UPI0021183EA2|nr:cytoplasmic tRNA 2-thiolation protein 2-A isoform X1 [Schistocerca nitens]
MCTVGDEDVGENSYMQPKNKSPVSNICRKCNENRAEVVLRKKHPYCRLCFVQAATHKFRATLGKSKIIRAGDNVMIAFSGSEASAALVHLVSVGLNEGNHKRLCFNPIILYVDEGCILGLSRDERKNISDAINRSLETYRLPTYMTSLEAFFNTQELNCCKVGTEMSLSVENEERLHKLFNQVKSLTSKEELLKILRFKILRRAAKSLNCSKIFVADTATGLATTLLTNVSLGRGVHLPLDVGFCDDTDNNLLILRPMRDFMKKEIIFYNVFNKVSGVHIPSIVTKVSSNQSIQKLTEKFVMELQQDYPSTASVVFRTGEKLSMPRDIKLSNETCSLCEAPLDDRNMKSSSLQATEFSRLASHLGPSGFSADSIMSDSYSAKNNFPSEIKEECQSESADKVDCSSFTDGCDCEHKCSPDMKICISDAEKCFCYSCRIILKELGSVEVLPQEVQTKIRNQLSFRNMRKEIADFLL